jgi:outer membrane protein
MKPNSPRTPSVSVASRRTSPVRTAGVILSAALVGSGLLPGRADAQEPGPTFIDLTLERMVELSLSSSYEVRRLNLEIQRDQYSLKAQQARLKSSVDLDLTVPAFSLTSEPKWNSDLQKNEIIQENTRMWEGEISVRQPIIFFGYPTNGYLSFNNRMYRYNQIDDDGVSEVDYYNRYYIRYTQPLFQPNGLKNDLEQAELNLEGTQLEFYGDVVDIVDNVSEDYFDLFEAHYRRTINQALVGNLERALAIARDLARQDSTRAIDADQIQVDLANARERLQSSESSIRLEAASVKRSLGLSDADSIALDPVFFLDPVAIDMDEAVRLAMELTPRMRQLDISLRNSEIDLEDTKSRGGFRMDLSLSYGRERRDDAFDRLWVHPDNSYTVNVEAYVPLWDWGERDARIAASRIRIDQTRLRIEEAELQIVSSVRNEVLNVRDREDRTMAMRENLELAGGVSETSFQRYSEGSITATDLMLSLRREADTAENFLQAYLGWRESLRRLQQLTYWDFERQMPVLERFGVEASLSTNGVANLRPDWLP